MPLLLLSVFSILSFFQATAASVDRARVLRAMFVRMRCSMYARTLCAVRRWLESTLHLRMRSDQLTSRELVQQVVGACAI